MSSPFALPLLSLGLLGVAVGVYDIHRGRNLAEREKVGGWGTYWDPTGFLWRGAFALVMGTFFLIYGYILALSQ
jgi:hypothetical protein